MKRETEYNTSAPRSRRRVAFDAPARYRIRVTGTPRFDWSDRLNGMSIQSNTPDDPDGITELEGWLADQGALSGVLQTLYELQLSLLSVEVLADKPEED